MKLNFYVVEKWWTKDHLKRWRQAHSLKLCWYGFSTIKSISCNGLVCPPYPLKFQGLSVAFCFSSSPIRYCDCVFIYPSSNLWFLGPTVSQDLSFWILCGEKPASLCSNSGGTLPLGLFWAPGWNWVAFCFPPTTSLITNTARLHQWVSRISSILLLYGYLAHFYHQISLILLWFGLRAKEFSWPACHSIFMCSNFYVMTIFQQWYRLEDFEISIVLYCTCLIINWI